MRVAGRLGWPFGTDRWPDGELFRYRITDLDFVTDSLDRPLRGQPDLVAQSLSGVGGGGFDVHPCCKNWAVPVFPFDRTRLTTPVGSSEW